MTRLLLLGPSVVLLTAFGGGAHRFAPLSIAFWDRGHGLLTGSSGDACGRTTGDRVEVRLTRDGGKTWRRVSTVCGAAGVRTFGESSAVMPVESGLLVTRDRGRTWSEVRTPPLESVSFATANDGWAARGFEPTWRLEATHDGGRSWRHLASPCERHEERAIVSRPTVGRGWIVCLGPPATGFESKRVYETTDGGRTWRLRASVDPSGRLRSVGWMNGYGHPAGIAMRPDGTGMIWQSRGGLLRTLHGGRAWVQLPLVDGEVTLVNDVAVGPGRVAYALEWDPDRQATLLERTDDDGRTWRAVHSWPVR